ncbi:MAG: hypothetical protein ACREAY_07340 [Nitrososphaera sp.]|uniref:hypothetical protein n=1 Tax=Nitrososphaera sp. TaxID=1971748 RepID=UPI003D6E6B02
MLAIDRVGMAGGDLQNRQVIHRLRQSPGRAVNYQYLVVSESVEDMPRIDVLAVKDIGRIKERLKKKIMPGVGLEMAVAPARKMDAGRWFSDVRELYSYCRSSGCQFILSSGADSLHSMVSGQCLDAILETSGIDPCEHWNEMNGWLESRLARRVRI